MTLAARRLYIDSALRTAGTAEDFTYQLPVSLDIPEGVIAYVDSVTLPNVFRTINADNRFLYLHEQDANGVDYFSKVTLDVGDYDGMSLAAHLLVQHSAATQVSQFYTAPFTVSPYDCNVTLDLDLLDAGGNTLDSESHTLDAPCEAQPQTEVVEVLLSSDYN